MSLPVQKTFHFILENMNPLCVCVRIVSVLVFINMLSTIIMVWFQPVINV